MIQAIPDILEDPQSFAACSGERPAHGADFSNAVLAPPARS
jgi:hypothetical protein